MVTVSSINSTSGQQSPTRKYAYAATGAAIGWEAKFQLEKL